MFEKIQGVDTEFLSENARRAFTRGLAALHIHCPLPHAQERVILLMGLILRPCSPPSMSVVPCREKISVFPGFLERRIAYRATEESIHSGLLEAYVAENLHAQHVLGAKRLLRLRGSWRSMPLNLRIFRRLVADGQAPLQNCA